MGRRQNHRRTPAPVHRTDAVIAQTERLMNSSSGNPRYRVYTTDGRAWTTEHDIDAAYGLTNEELRAPNVVTLSIRNNQIVDVEPAVLS